ncbi:hypothetical protein [Kingella denitrificans]|uniref:hypothetical protein n=1 Tax=Kingella denitrificans TaxID=502 RepID=UPI00288B5CC6|nr:hypothetical protein [Kingella denitrificans]
MKKIFSLCISLSLAACAGNNAGFQNQVGLVAQKIPNAIILRVPATGNPVSNLILATSIEASASLASKGIVQDLAKRPDGLFAITGDSQAVNVATLKRVLADLNSPSRATVYIQADENQIRTLQEIAAPKGITVKNLR